MIHDFLNLVAVISEESGVTIGVCLAAAGGLWYLGRELQSLRDGLKHLSESLKGVMTSVQNLPCQHCRYFPGSSKEQHNEDNH